MTRVYNLPKEYDDLRTRIMELLEKNPGQSVKELAKQLKINRTFLAGYLKALENQGYVKLKKIGPAKVYFREEPKKEQLGMNEKRREW